MNRPVEAMLLVACVAAVASGCGGLVADESEVRAAFAAHGFELEQPSGLHVFYDEEPALDRVIRKLRAKLDLDADPTTILVAGDCDGSPALFVYLFPGEGSARSAARAYAGEPPKSPFGIAHRGNVVTLFFRDCADPERVHDSLAEV